MRADLQQQAVQLAARSGGAVRLRDLTPLGISDDAAERAVAAGRWVRLARGWYVPHPKPLSPLRLARAAAADAGDRCVVSGLVVLSELGLPWLPPVQRAHLLVPDDTRLHSSPVVRLTRTSRWPVSDTWLRAGLRMAPVERAVVDAARSLSDLRDVRGVVFGAVRHGCAPGDLLSVLDAGQRNGSGLTRRAIGDAVRGCASPPEAELVDALVGRGHCFLVNPELRVDGALLGYPDVWLLDLNVGGEVESREWHEGDERAESTYDRHERFAAAGVPLVHLGVGRLRRDIDAAAAYLLQRGVQMAAPAPQGLTVLPRGPLLR